MHNQKELASGYTFAQWRKAPFGVETTWPRVIVVTPCDDEHDARRVRDLAIRAGARGAIIIRKGTP